MSFISSVGSKVDIFEQKEELKIDKKDELTQRIFGCLALGAMGDTLGFGSGHNPQPGILNTWELSGSTEYMLNTLEENFGDYRAIHFRNNGEQVWVVSDDTILHVLEAETIVSIKKPTPEKIVRQLACRLIPIYEEEVLKKRNERCFGRSTRNMMKNLKEDPEHWEEHISYNREATGCGGAMRGMIFGWAFPGASHRQELIATAVNAGFLTNPSLVGILGTVSTAALTAFAVEDLPLADWNIQLFQTFLETKSYLENLKKEPLSENYFHLIEESLDPEEWKTALENWQFYFDEIAHEKRGVPLRQEFPTTYQERDQLHIEIEEHVRHTASDPKRLTIGDRGDTSVMLALQGLMLGIRLLLEEDEDKSHTKPSYLREIFHKLPLREKQRILNTIVKFTVLHGGDSDSTGGIALSLFGSIFGIEGVELAQILELEGIEKIVATAKKFRKKFKKITKMLDRSG